MEEKKIFNLDSEEKFEECRILGGNPSGILNFNKTKHKWAKSLWDNMQERTWFVGHINVSQDKANYGKLRPEYKRTYDLVLAQLITNDSIQTNQLMDKINSYITSPIVNACLSKQSTEEALHSFSYAVMAEDIAQDTDRIYNMHKHDEELYLKNKAVQDMYTNMYNEEQELSKEDLLVAFCANQILEELVFPGGFAAMFTIGDEMPGTSMMIAEIK